MQPAVITAARASSAHSALAFALVAFAFAGATAVMGSRRLKPPDDGRYAQAQGRWRADQLLKWVFLAVGVGALIAAAALAV